MCGWKSLLVLTCLLGIGKAGKGSNSNIGSTSSIEESDTTGGSAAGGHIMAPGMSPQKYEKIDKYSSTFYPSSAVNYYSAYGYPANIPYNYHSNPYIPGPEYERNGKDFSTRAASTMPLAASTNFGYTSKEVTGPEYGGLAMASGGGSGGHGHGHGHGWGWGKGHGGGGYHGSKVDTSAIGLLGLIGLLSLLQNVLMNLTSTTTTTAATTGRKKRDADDGDMMEDSIQRVNRVSLKVLPHLNVIAHARAGRVPLECTHREVCAANQLLVKEFGLHGRSVGSMMSSAITKMLKEMDPYGEAGKHLTKAGLTGRNGGDCLIAYPLCEAISRRMEPLPILLHPDQLEQLTLSNHKTLIGRTAQH